MPGTAVAGTTTTTTPSQSGALAVDLNAIFQSELATDIRMDGRAHGRYLQVMDRAYLSNYLNDQDPIAGQIAGMNTASHAPTAQPFAVPNWVTTAAAK